MLPQDDPTPPNKTPAKGGYFAQCYAWAQENAAYYTAIKMNQQWSSTLSPIHVNEELTAEHLGIGDHRGALSYEPALGTPAPKAGPWPITVKAAGDGSYLPATQQFVLDVQKISPQLQVGTLENFEHGSVADIPARIRKLVRREGDGAITYGTDLNSIRSPGKYAVDITVEEGSNHFRSETTTLTFEIEPGSLDIRLEEARSVVVLSPNKFPKTNWQDILSALDKLEKMRFLDPQGMDKGLSATMQMFWHRVDGLREAAKQAADEVVKQAEQACIAAQSLEGFENIGEQVAGLSAEALQLASNAHDKVNTDAAGDTEFDLVAPARLAAERATLAVDGGSKAKASFHKAQNDAIDLAQEAARQAGDAKALAASLGAYGEVAWARAERLLLRCAAALESATKAATRDEAKLALTEAQACRQAGAGALDFSKKAELRIAEHAKEKTLAQIAMKGLQPLYDKFNFEYRNDKSGYKALRESYEALRADNLFAGNVPDHQKSWAKATLLANQMQAWLIEKTKNLPTAEEIEEREKSERLAREKYEAEKLADEDAEKKRRKDERDSALDRDAMALEYARYRWNDRTTWNMKATDNRGAPMHKLNVAASDQLKLDRIAVGELGNRGDTMPVAGVGYHAHMINDGGGGIAFVYQHLGGNRVRPVIYDWADSRADNKYEWKAAKKTDGGAPAKPKDIVADRGG